MAGMVAEDFLRALGVIVEIGGRDGGAELGEAILNAGDERGEIHGLGKLEIRNVKLEMRSVGQKKTVSPRGAGSPF